tara:strand:+ start:10344 stop:12716 length:2373 start_codon:yes stop_codon:yes gene_type:complete
VWRLSRTGTIEPNATTTNQRAATFAASAPNGSVLLTRRDSDGLSHWLIAPDETGVEQSALHLAQTVAARAEERVDSVPELFDSRAIAVARYDTGSIIGRDTQVGSDMSEIAGRLASSLSPGEWVAAVLRRPEKHEIRRYQKWLSNQIGGGNLPQHHSMQQSSIVMSIWSGADSAAEAKALLRQVTAAMPGFDIQISPHSISKTLGGLSMIAGGLGGFAAGVWTLNTDLFYASDSVELAAGFAAGMGLPAAAAGVLFLLGRVPSYAEKVRRLARYNMLLEPAKRILPPGSPKREHQTKDGVTVQGTNGQYPLGAGSFMAGAQLAVGIVAPHAGAASGTSSTQMRVAPSIMREPIGPLVGDNDGRPVYLSSADAWAGTILFGQAGSGKSRLVQSLFAHSGLERSRPSGRPGFPGARNSLIAFESKGEGADAYVEWANIVDDKALRIDFAGPGSIQLDILSIPGAADVRARAVVNAMKYAFSDGSIQERSFDTLIQVLTAGFAVTPDVAVVAELEPNKSPFYYANVLLGGRGDAFGVALAGAIRSEVARLGLDETTDLGMAGAMLQALYSGKTPAQRSTFTDAPRSKVSALLAAESWWGRPNKISWDRLLTEHRSVIINTGVTRAGHEADDALVAQFSAMMMYTLYSAIKRCCSEWREAGRSVSLYADELKLLAGSSATVIAWLRDQGRSYGVRSVFATQYPEQLVPEVRNAVMGFGTLMAFSQSNPEVVKGLVADLSLSGDVWTGADVANLPAYEAIVRASAGQQRQAPFTLSIRDFWANRATFIEDQGYGA